MKKASLFLKITGCLCIAASLIHFLFGLTFLHFFSSSLTMGAVSRDRVPLLAAIMISAGISSVVILISGIVGVINSIEPLKAAQTVKWAVYALVFGLVSEVFVRLFGYESSMIFTASGILVPVLHLAAAVLFLVLAKKGYRLHGTGKHQS